MRDPSLVRRARPRRQDAQVAIDLAGVGVDHHAARRLRQLDRERALAARGRPCDERDAGLVGDAMFTATLIAAGRLTPTIVAERENDQLAAGGCVPTTLGWIDKGDADLHFELAPAEARAALENGFTSASTWSSSHARRGARCCWSPTSIRP
ncbi:hypothetical protein AB5I41_16985 [Sphingomonas sp. MMS24-JH45]